MKQVKKEPPETLLAAQNVYDIQENKRIEKEEKRMSILLARVVQNNIFNDRFSGMRLDYRPHR